MRRMGPIGPIASNPLDASLSGSEINTASAGGRNSEVECKLPKLDVVGSIPIARSLSWDTTPGIFQIRQADTNGPMPLCQCTWRAASFV